MLEEGPKLMKVGINTWIFLLYIFSCISYLNLYLFSILENFLGFLISVVKHRRDNLFSLMLLLGENIFFRERKFITGFPFSQ